MDDPCLFRRGAENGPPWGLFIATRLRPESDLVETWAFHRFPEVSLLDPDKTMDWEIVRNRGTVLIGRYSSSSDDFSIRRRLGEKIKVAIIDLVLLSAFPCEH